MNLFAATSWESLLILLAFVALSALPAWLKRHRLQKAADVRAGETETSSTSRTPGRSTGQFNWEQALRQLLGGEPVPEPLPSTPSAPATSDDRGRRMRAAEAHLQRVQARTGVAIADLENPIPSTHSPPPQAMAGKDPAARFRLRSQAGARAVTLVRAAHTVRQAFIASSILESPKGLDT